MVGNDTNAGQQPVPSDYDGNPDRMRLARSVLRRHAAAGDVHELVARRFVSEGLARVLDVGCGEGELARFLPDGAWVGVDNSPAMLARAPTPNVLGEANALPFRDSSFKRLIDRTAAPSAARRCAGSRSARRAAEPRRCVSAC